MIKTTLFIFLLCLASLVQAQRNKAFQYILEAKTGYSNAPVTAFKQWATSQNVYNAAGRADNISAGFTFGLTFHKAVIQLGMDYDAGSQKIAKPYRSLFTLGGGYQFLHSRHIDINLLANMGVGDVKVRFRQQVPVDFTVLPYSGNNSFAKKNVLMAQPVIIFNFKPGKSHKDDNEDEHFGIIYSVKFGIDTPIIAGRWKYGRSYQTSNNANSSTTIFRGTVVNMPNFYKMAFFIQFGVGFILETND